MIGFGRYLIWLCGLLVACDRRIAPPSTSDAGALPSAPHEPMHTARTLATLHHPHEVAVSGTTLYVTDVDYDDPGEAADIIAIPLAGGVASKFARKQRTGQSLTIAGSRLLWVIGGDVDRRESAWVMSSPLSHGAPTRLTKTFVFADNMIAVLGETVFFFSPVTAESPAAGVMKMELSAGAKPQQIAKADRDGDRQVLAVDSLHAYWVDNRRIVQASITGGEATVVAPCVQVRGMLSDNHFLYWTEMGEGTKDAGSVRRVSVSGGPVEVLASGLERPWGIAADDATIYWAENSDRAGSINKRAKAGGPVYEIANGQRSPVHLAVDASNVYWGNAETGEVMTVNK